LGYFGLTGSWLGRRFELMGAINPDFVSQTQVFSSSLLLSSLELSDTKVYAP